MKVLWVINKPLPEISKELGLKVELSQSWLHDLSRALRVSGIVLCTACVDNVKRMLVTNIYGANHYVIPIGHKFKSKNSYKKYWKEIIESEQPNLIHVHGTEYRHALPLLELYPKIPALLTIQGIMTRISEHFYGGLTSYEVFKYRTIKENIRLGGMFFTKQLYKKQAKTEYAIIKNVDAVTGRTLWDYSVIKQLNPNIRYFRCWYNLRAEFYDANKWDIEQIDKYSIYTSFSSYPLKGLHILLKAVALVKEEFPNVLVKVPGVKGDATGKLIVTSGYTKYLQKLIRRYALENNVQFLGGQTTQEVIQNLQKSHLCIVSSAIEGASATLREAMHIGLPCIASYRGGMTELLSDGESGFYYDYSEFPYLAERICELFRDDQLSRAFSRKSIEKAEALHDRKKNVEDMLKIYKELVSFNKE